MNRFFLSSVLCVVAGIASVSALDAPPVSSAPTTEKATTAATAPALTVDDGLPDYTPVRNLSGTINSTGSSTVSNFLNRWAIDFRRLYPDVRLTITGGGSSSALGPLLRGESNFAPMSRAMDEEELSQFKKKFGYLPTRIVVAADALAIFVNKDNPLEAISLAQADGIFSSTLKRGGPSLEMWGDLGLTDSWKNRPIYLIGLDAKSGSSEVFRELVLKGGEYRLSLEKDLVSSSVIQGVGADSAAIGYGSFVLRTKRARAVPIIDETGKSYAPTQENVLSGKYPLSRFLSIYVNISPKKELEPAPKELLKYILSKDGQSVLVAGGNMPLSQAIVAEQRKLLGY
jgi:phosphate transport system substrate-binding protein